MKRHQYYYRQNIHRHPAGGMAVCVLRALCVEQVGVSMPG